MSGQKFKRWHYWWDGFKGIFYSGIKLYFAYGINRPLFRWWIQVRFKDTVQGIIHHQLQSSNNSCLNVANSNRTLKLQSCLPSCFTNNNRKRCMMAIDMKCTCWRNSIQMQLNCLTVNTYDAAGVSRRSVQHFVKIDKYVNIIELHYYISNQNGKSIQIIEICLALV